MATLWRRWFAAERVIIHAIEDSTFALSKSPRPAW